MQTVLRKSPVQMFDLRKRVNEFKLGFAKNTNFLEISKKFDYASEQTPEIYF